MRRMCRRQLRTRPKCIPMEEIRDIPIPPEDRVFFYDERDKSLYAAKMEEVVAYILVLEPGDQVDACAFNREMMARSRNLKNVRRLPIPLRISWKK